MKKASFSKICCNKRPDSASTHTAVSVSSFRDVEKCIYFMLVVRPDQAATASDGLIRLVPPVDGTEDGGFFRDWCWRRGVIGSSRADFVDGRNIFLYWAIIFETQIN